MGESFTYQIVVRIFSLGAGGWHFLPIFVFFNWVFLLYSPLGSFGRRCSKGKHFEHDLVDYRRFSSEFFEGDSFFKISDFFRYFVHFLNRYNISEVSKGNVHKKICLLCHIAKGRGNLFKQRGIFLLTNKLPFRNYPSELM